MTRSDLIATAAELHRRHPDGYDVLFVTPDALVDHPAFAAALLARVIEEAGYRVALCVRPDPEDPQALAAYGVPRLFVAIGGGALDSMLANYTAQKKPRSDDPYAAGDTMRPRPDRVLTVYGNLARRAFGKDSLIVLGGIEAGLRAFAHYDFWTDKVRRPLLLDAGADLLVRGMGETPLRALLATLDAARRQGLPWKVPALLPALREIPGLVWRQSRNEAAPEDAVELPESDVLAQDKAAFARMQHTLETRAWERFTQAAGGQRIVANPLAAPLSSAELDALYALPFSRAVHPLHQGAQVPALEQVRFSVVSHRGCAGGCAFCAISLHQGRKIVSRSEASVRRELAGFVRDAAWRGTVNDVGGPSANMFGYSCTGPERCARVSCLWPKRCPQFVGTPARYAALLELARKEPGIKHLFVTTGLRLELAMESPDFIRGVARHHVSGRLKVAPEHCVPAVLNAMRKPAGEAFEPFLRAFVASSKGLGKRQEVLPYLMAAHPGCSLANMLELALLLKRLHVVAEQCQIFTPTPGSAATAMYFTGLDPATLAPIFVERDPKLRELQKALILYHEPQSAPLIREALARLGRPELASLLLGR